MKKARTKKRKMGTQERSGAVPSHGIPRNMGGRKKKGRKTKRG